ncbi:hypothetical protein [Mesorhizobium caraganae]|uniref:hypothetical protein n=1 Tax=Mesorhizobium caraganae TaxID=483206 RepID=UPI00177C232B|nr:hypothetical protein [Mesorhizobium caraganae]
MHTEISSVGLRHHGHIKCDGKRHEADSTDGIAINQYVDLLGDDGLPKRLATRRSANQPNTPLGTACSRGTVSRLPFRILPGKAVR